MANQCTIFDDHAVEIQELTKIVKEVSRKGIFGGRKNRITSKIAKML